MVEEQKGIAEAEQILEELEFDLLPIIPSKVVKAISSDHFNVVLEMHEFSSKKILGKAQGNDSAALIYINKNIPDQRRLNFTVAHEIGHVCMHIMPRKKMLFACGAKELSNPFNDPLEMQANGFASGLLMPKKLISRITNGEINWENIYAISTKCESSLEATFRRMLLLNNEPFALIIHQNGEFKRFVPSQNFDFFIKNSPLSTDQRESLVNVAESPYPSDFDEVDAIDWVNTCGNGVTIERLYVSSILLDKGFSYSLVTYDEDCLIDEDE